MFDKKQRDKLDKRIALLINWKDAIPAAEFQRQCKRLLEEFNTERHRSFWYIISNETVHTLEQRYESLEKIGIGLRGLIAGIQPLTNELEVVQGSFLKEEEITVIEYGKNLCEQWRSDLSLVSTCTREADVIAAKQTLRLIEESLRLHAEALHVFQEADGILSVLQRNTETAILDSQLRRQREEMTQGRLSLDGILNIKTLCEPLEALSKRPEPQEIRLVSEALAEIRWWTRTLELPSEDQQSLEKRHRQLEADWRKHDSTELEQLLIEAQALKTARIHQGHHEREGKLLRLQEALNDLMRACGPQPESELSLNALKQIRVVRAHEHSTWLEAFKKANEEFKAIADTHETALEKRLDERCIEWATGLSTLQAMPLAHMLRQQAKQLQQRLDKLNDHKGAQDLLISLREANHGLTELAALKIQADADREGFDQIRRQLRTDNASLQLYATQTGQICENLQAAIDTLGENADNPDLDQVLANAVDLQRQLERLSSIFINNCHNALRLGQNQSLQAALLQAGVTETFAMPQVVDLPNDPAQCAGLLHDQATLRVRLE